LVYHGIRGCRGYYFAATSAEKPPQSGPRRLLRKLGRATVELCKMYPPQPLVQRQRQEQIFTETAEVLMQKNKLREIFQNLFAKAMEKLEENPESKGKEKIFISFTDGEDRAITVCGIGNTFKTAFKQASDRALKNINAPKYIKLQIVRNEIPTTVGDYYEMLKNTRRGYLRCGVAFDEMYNTAFLEQELYANVLITDRFNEGNITKYMKAQKNAKKDFVFEAKDTDDMIIFETVSSFYDGENYFDIEDDMLSSLKGIRKIHDMGRDFVYDCIIKSAEYLYSTLEDDGKIAYGYFPAFHTQLPHYDIIGHTLSGVAFADTYILTKDEKYKMAGQKAVDYLINNYIYFLDDDTAFVLDKVNDTDIEIKLGALGVAVLAIAKIMEITKNSGHYINILRKLGNGIMYMQNQETGNYVHVLEYPTMGVKEEFRTAHYAGEAVFALSALYSMDKNEIYLNSAKKAMKFFVEKDNHKYYDQNLAYVVNGMNDLKESKLHHLLKGRDLSKFYEAMGTKFEEQIASIMYPEMAMFFKQPNTIMWGITVRHQSFRIRNDDVSNHLIECCSYYRYKLLEEKNADKEKTAGYWLRDSNKLGALDRARFALAEFLNVKFFCFDINDIDLEKKEINGLFYNREEEKYERRVTKYPNLVDYRLANCFEKKHEDAFNSIKETSYIVQNKNIGSKNQVNKKIEASKFAKNRIETYPYDSSKIRELLSKHGTLILKPSTGSNGRGIYKLTAKSEDVYTLHYLEQSQEISHNDCINKFEAEFEESYIMQEYIDSTTRDGIPIDIRLNVARGLNGKFRTTVLYCRYGSKEYIGTNMGKAARSVSKDVRSNLKWHFGDDNGQKLYDDLKEFEKGFPDEFQKKTSFLIAELCFDIGINRATNTLHIFEVGVSPGTSAIIPPYELAEQNVGFYKYLLTKR